MESIINHTYTPSKEEIARYFPFESFMIHMICCGSYAHIPTELPSTVFALWKSSFLYESAWKFIEFNPFLITNSFKPNEKLLIIGCNNSELDALYKISFLMHNEFTKNDITITSVVSRLSGEITDLYSTLIRANLYFKDNILFAESSYHVIDCKIIYNKSPHINKLLTNDIQKYVSILIKQKQSNNLKIYLHKIFENLHTQNLQQIILQDYLEEILSLIIKCLELPYSSKDCQNSIYEIFGTHTSLNGLFEDFWKIVQDFIVLKQVIEDQCSLQSTTMQKVKEYIDQ